MSNEENKNRLVFGSLCMICAALMFALAGMSVKMAADSLSSATIVFWRNVISLMILTPLALLNHKQWFRRDNMKLITFRALAVLAIIYCYFYTISVMRLADAALLTFSSPIFVPIFGLLLYRFTLDIKVLIAILIGFIGVMLVLQPGAEVFNPVALVGLLGGAVGGFAVVVLWKMPSSENPARIAFFVALFGLAISSVPILLSGEWPVGDEWLPLLMLGVFSTAAQLLFAYACLIAPADRVITLDYMALLFASALGWLIWGEQPNAMFVFGGVLIIGAGIFVMLSRPKQTQPLSTRRSDQFSLFNDKVFQKAYGAMYCPN